MEKITYILSYLKNELDEKSKERFESKLKEDPLFAAEVAEVCEDWNRQRLSDWLDGRLSEAEAQALSLELENNATLRQELTELKQAKEVLSTVHRNAILQDVEKIATQEAKKVPLRSQRKTWLRAASILFLLAALSTYFLYLPTRFSNSALSTKHLELYPGKGSLLTAGSDDAQKSVYAEGIIQYDQRAYSAAIISFKKIPASSSYYKNGQFYLANAYLGLGQPERAAPVLSQLLSLSLDASVKSRIQWYLALSYLKAEQETEAIEQLKALAANNADLFYQGKAKAILDDLSSFYRTLPKMK